MLLDHTPPPTPTPSLRPSSQALPRLVKERHRVAGEAALPRCGRQADNAPGLNSHLGTALLGARAGGVSQRPSPTPPGPGIGVGGWGLAFTSCLAVNIQLRANLGQGPPRTQHVNPMCPRPQWSAAAQKPAPHLCPTQPMPRALMSGRTDCRHPSWGHIGCKVSFQVASRLTPHNVPLQSPAFLDSHAMTRPPVHPPRAPHGCWALTLRGQTQIPQETRKAAAPPHPGLQLAPGTPPPTCELPADHSARCPPTAPPGAPLRTPHLLSCGRPAAAGWRLADLRARAWRLGALLAFGCAPLPRERAAAARLPGQPHPRPAPGPTRPYEKALIGKNHPGAGRGFLRGTAGARRELRRLGSRRRPYPR